MMSNGQKYGQKILTKTGRKLHCHKISNVINYRKQLGLNNSSTLLQVS